MPTANQIYLGLPDGGLAQSSELDEMLNDVTIETAPDRIFTMGSTGYDGHVDHILTHNAARQTAHILRQLGHEVTTFAITPDHTGELQITGDRHCKTGAMALHASQVVVPDLQRWGDTELYTPLITGAETYDIN